MKKIALGITSGLITLVSLPVFALAVAPSGGSTGDSQTINLKDLNPFGDCDKLSCVLGPIFNILFYVSIPVCSIIVLWGGFQILTAGGDAEKVKTGGKTILYAAVGFVIVLLSNGIVSIITSVVTP